jgi:hypothetical protein
MQHEKFGRSFEEEDQMEGDYGAEDEESEEVESDLDDIDFLNYKGIYYGDSAEKYQCPVSGAHFKHEQMCGIL